MDLLKELIGRKENSSPSVPSVQEWLQIMPTHYLILLCAASTMSCITIILGAIHLIFVIKFIRNEEIRTDLYWLVFMCPAISIAGTLGMAFPRGSLFLYSLALAYFMICLFVLVCLMTTLNSNRHTMCKRLTERNVEINPRVFPLGCCLCLPKITPNEHNFRRIEWLVFQSPIVRIFLEILNILVFMELSTRDHLFFQISNLIGIISLLIGSYGCYLIIPPTCHALLTTYRFSLLFRIVDLCQLIYSIQKFIVEFLAIIGIIRNEQFLPATSKGAFIICFMLTSEMCLASCICTIFFKPSKTAFFEDQNPIDNLEESMQQPEIASKIQQKNHAIKLRSLKRNVVYSKGVEE